MEEAIVMTSPGIYRHNGSKPKKTLFRAKLGTLVLTNQRLIFLSTGPLDTAQRSLLGYPRRPNIDMSAPQNEGSLSIPLQELAYFQFVGNRFQDNYLSIGVKTESGVEEYAFANQQGIPGGSSWEKEIAEAKEALGSSGPPSWREHRC